jgi:hypothetical protein
MPGIAFLGVDATEDARDLLIATTADPDIDAGVVAGDRRSEVTIVSRVDQIWIARVSRSLGTVDDNFGVSDERHKALPESF